MPSSASTIDTLSLHDALPIFSSTVTEKLTVVSSPTGTSIPCQVMVPAASTPPSVIEFATNVVLSGILSVRMNPTIGTVPVFLRDRKSTRLNSSHVKISYAVFCLHDRHSFPTRRSSDLFVNRDGKADGSFLPYGHINTLPSDGSCSFNTSVSN